jgi:hypothetical protein
MIFKNFLNHCLKDIVNHFPTIKDVINFLFGNEDVINWVNQKNIIKKINYKFIKGK